MSSKKYPDPAYDITGREVAVLAETHDGFCVRTCIDPEAYGEVFTEPRIVNRLYSKAELSEFLADYVKQAEDVVRILQANADALRQEILQSRKKLTEITAQLGQRAVQIQSKLGRLYDFLDDKITHFVEYEYGVAIKTKEEALKTERTGEMRLLSLYGDSKGDLNWKINEYKDGSGRGTPAIPCCSLEDAVLVAQQKLDEQVFAIRLKPDSYSVGRAFNAAAKLGLKIHPDIIDMHKKFEREAAEKQRNDARLALEEKEAALAKLQD